MEIICLPTLKLIWNPDTSVGVCEKYATISSTDKAEHIRLEKNNVFDGWTEKPIDVKVLRFWDIYLSNSIKI